MGGIGDEPSLWISAGDALLSAIVKPAHAATVGGVAGWIWEGVNWIIPLEDIGTLGKQLWYLSTNDPRFDAVELSLATLGTLSIIPIAKPFLRPVVTPLKRMVRFANTVNPKFVRSFGSVIGKLVKQAWDRRSFQVLLDVLPFLIIAGDLMLDPEARDGLTLLIQTVQSDDDILAWIDYLRLPDEEWQGTEPPELDLLASNLSPNGFDSLYAGLNPLSWLIKDAQAANGSAARASREAMKRLLRALRNLDNAAGGNNRGAIIDGIKGVTKAMKNTDLPQLRRATFNAQTVVAGARIGQTALKRLYRRARNLRIPPFAIAAIITSLEMRRTSCAAELPGCEPLERGVATKLKYLYSQAFSKDLLNPDRDFAYGTRENGWFFHLGVLAYYQLSYEANNPPFQPIAAESQMSVQLRKKELNRNEFINAGRPYQRSTDIVLYGEGGEEGRVLVETKSYKKPVNKRYFKQWNLSKGKKLTDADGNDRSNHKQFFLDRVAIARLPIDNYQRLAGDFKWWFHNFHRSTIDGYGPADVTKALRYLQKLPSSNKIGSNSLGLDRGNPTTDLSSKVSSFGLKTLLLEELRTRLFDGVEDDVYTTLVTNSTHDQ